MNLSDQSGSVCALQSKWHRQELNQLIANGSVSHALEHVRISLKGSAMGKSYQRRKGQMDLNAD
jgi:hypothetical protein